MKEGRKNGSEEGRERRREGKKKGRRKRYIKFPFFNASSVAAKQNIICSL